MQKTNGFSDFYCLPNNREIDGDNLFD